MPSADDMQNSMAYTWLVRYKWAQPPGKVVRLYPIKLKTCQPSAQQFHS